MDDNVVYLNVPQPLFDVDAELNLMANLEYVMEHNRVILTDEERKRVVDWFCSRYAVVKDAVG